MNAQALRARAEACAYRALMYELSVSPKPGLVDFSSRGAHMDMDARVLEASARAIAPHIGACAEIGRQTRAFPPKKAFSRLRAQGLCAQKAMLAATNGVNAHKGAIFCLGLLAGAFGRLAPRGERGFEAAAREICASAGLLCARTLQSEIANTRNARTHGEKALCEAGLSGARGEAAAGYPRVVRCALPAYLSARKRGMSENDAGARALLCLIAQGKDTCLYARGGKAGLAFAQNGAKRALLAGDDWIAQARALNKAFVARGLSPGGCADLLCAMKFLLYLTQPQARPEEALL